MVSLHGKRLVIFGCGYVGSALARAALAAAPAQAVYARVDMIEDNDGALAIMELELIEPALFLHQSAASAAMFGAAVASAARALRA